MGQPLSFEQFKVLKNKGLSPEQIAKFEQGVKPKPTIPSTFLPRLEETEKLISERPTAIETLAEETVTPATTRRGKILKPLVTGLKAAAVPFGQITGAIAGPALKFQKEVGDVPIPELQQLTEKSGRTGLTQEEKQRMNILTRQEIKRTGRFIGGLGKEAWAGLRGEKAPRFADIMRVTGFGGKYSDLISEATGFFAELGLVNVLTKGHLLRSGQKGKDFISTRAPRVINKDWALKRADIAKGGLDDLRKGLSNEYDDLYRVIGNNMRNPKKVINVMENVSPKVINQITKDNLITKFSDGSIQPTLNNIKRMRKILGDNVSSRVWNKRIFADQDERIVKEAWSKLGDIMTEGEPQLSTLNTKYHNFLKMADPLYDVLLDKYGNTRAKGLQSLFSKGGERRTQLYFEKFAKQWPRAKQIMKDMQQYQRRQTLKRIGGYGARTAGRAAIIGGLIKGGLGREE